MKRRQMLVTLQQQHLKRCLQGISRAVRLGGTELLQRLRPQRLDDQHPDFFQHEEAE